MCFTIFRVIIYAIFDIGTAWPTSQARRKKNRQPVSTSRLLTNRAPNVLGGPNTFNKRNACVLSARLVRSGGILRTISDKDVNTSTSKRTTSIHAGGIVHVGFFELFWGLF